MRNKLIRKITKHAIFKINLWKVIEEEINLTRNPITFPLFSYLWIWVLNFYVKHSKKPMII